MGSSTSSTVSGHKKDNLCNQRDVVERELNLLDESRTIVRRRTLIMIVNKSKKYPLVHSSHGDSNGYFFSDAQTAFQHNYKFLDKQYENAIVPGETGGILHSQYAVQDIFGSSGYVSFMVPTEGKNYVVCCGFYNTTLSATSAGIEIRGEDGNTDSFGRIIGHGVTPTGVVKDIDTLAQKVPHATNNDIYETFSEQNRCFKVTCQFTNNLASTFIYTLTDF